MAKISSEDRHVYFEKSKQYRNTIEAILAREKNILAAIEKDANGASFKRLMLADDMLNMVSFYLVISGISSNMLGVKNEDALNDARKALYKSVIYLEEIVSGLVDVPFSDYEEKLSQIAAFGAARRYALVRKLGLAIRLVKDAYGDNTKWKWTFVDLEGRFAAVAKNLFDLKSAGANLDMRSPDYEVTIYHLRTVKKLLMQAADRYREKYELSTNRIDDFKLAIAFLGALRRINVLMGDRDEAETVKKKAEVWSAKLEADQKKQEEAANRR